MKTLKQFAMKRSRGFSEKSKIICSPNFLIERNLIHSSNLNPKDNSNNILGKYTLLDIIPKIIVPTYTSTAQFQICLPHQNHSCMNGTKLTEIEICYAVPCSN